MRHKNFYRALIVNLIATSAWATQIDGIQFKFDDNQSVVEISGSDLGAYTKSEKKNPPQLILTFKDAKVAEEALKTVDTSSFSKSNVLQINAYPLNGSDGKPGQTRVVINFKKSTGYTFAQEDGKLLVKVSDSGAEAGDIADTQTPPADAAPGAMDADKSSDPLAQAEAATKDQKFTGSPISLNLKDADVQDVLRMIGDASGFSMSAAGVTGKITLALDDVPWDQALEVVLSNLKLGAERNGKVLRILPRDQLMAEKQSQLDAKRLAQQSAPRITRVFPISYSDLKELAGILDKFATAQNTLPGNAGGQTIPTTILIDTTTQSLIVRDTVDGLDRIRKMIQILDVQTPQVIIEGKVIEATEGFSSSLGGQFGIGGARYGFSANGSSNLIGAPVIGSATTPGVLGAAGAGIGAGADIFNIAGKMISLNASLSVAEQQNKIKVVSSPKVSVLSGKTATISQTTSIGVTQITPGTSTSPPTSQIVPVNAVTQLTVTPRVTNDGSVLMTLDLKRDILSTTDPTKSPVTEPRAMKTDVIVDSGSTLVIGGVLNIDENHSESGMPILRKIPIIGWLFGTEGDIKNKTELMFFITPRVLNQKKTALSNPDAGGGSRL